jgi:hypothetical protein
LQILIHGGLAVNAFASIAFGASGAIEFSDAEGSLSAGFFDPGLVFGI